AARHVRGDAARAELAATRTAPGVHPVRRTAVPGRGGDRPLVERPVDRVDRPAVGRGGSGLVRLAAGAGPGRAEPAGRAAVPGRLVASHLGVDPPAGRADPTPGLARRRLTRPYVPVPGCGRAPRCACSG